MRCHHAYAVLASNSAVDPPLSNFLPSGLMASMSNTSSNKNGLLPVAAMALSRNIAGTHRVQSL